MARNKIGRGKINVSEMICPFCKKHLRILVFFPWALTCDNKRCTAYGHVGDVGFWTILTSVWKCVDENVRDVIIKSCKGKEEKNDTLPNNH